MNNLINIRHRFASRPLHDQSAIFVLPSHFFAMDNYYPVTLQAHGAWYHVQVLINVTIQAQCLFVTWLPRYKVLAFTKGNHEDQNQFSSTLTRQHARFKILLVLYITGNFVPSRKDHFPRITLPLTNQIAWFVTLHCDLSIAEWSCSKAILKWTNTSGLEPVQAAVAARIWRLWHYHWPIRLHHLQHCDSSVLERKWSCKTTSLIPRRPLIFVLRFAFFS